MATLKQYEFFQALYREESEREEQLINTAKTYLSLATLYSAFVLLVVDKLKPHSPSGLVIFLASIASMIVAFLFSLSASKVSVYEAINEPRDVIKEFGNTPMADEDFFDARIADYTIACERNSNVNDKKADRLEWAAYALLAGIALQAAYVAFNAILLQVHTVAMNTF